MVSDQLDEEAIFQAARVISSRDARLQYLQRACGDDAALFDRVSSLLRAFEEENEFLESPPPGIEATLGFDEFCEGPGSVIGPYKLHQQIGEGGMGVVFMAEQTQPVRRTVALKIIKPGMDTRQVIARFEAERQALAMMDHPNIAKVLDAGTTGGSNSLSTQARGGDGERGRGGDPDVQASLRVSPSPLLPLSPSTSPGRPYFVMDLVKGVPITTYCDQRHFSVRRRLELMIQVCHAVQHAHQKGVIHRDLKPSNVLVAEYDGEAVPKIIDFGVAKATAQRLTDRTMFTEHGQLIGTFEYMSPEQARFNQLDVDTRSDIYSLGVLLYELLTGTTPFERSRLETLAFDETLRVIREEEPPKPSTRLSRSGESSRTDSAKSPARLAGPTLSTIAGQRQSEPAKLSREIRGELDWIVMKALEKDRNRRYETASSLARDLERYLADEPVSAAAPSQLYRVGKFVRRNRVPVAAACLAIAAILVGVVATGWQAVRATRAERTAVSERDAKELALRQAVASADKARAAAAAERVAKEREVAQRKRAEDISNFLISAFNAQYPEHDIQALAEVLKRSEQELQGAYADDPMARSVFLATMGRAHAGLRRFGDAEQMYRKCLEVATDPGLIDRVRRELATCLLRQGKMDDVVPMLHEFFVDLLHRSDSPAADELLAAWDGLPDLNATADGTPGMDGLAFDGDGDFVILPRLFFDGRPPWTLEVIVWPIEVDPSDPVTGSPTGWTSLISTADGGSIGLDSIRRRWTIELYTAGIPGAEWTDNYASASAGTDVALRQWQHVAGVWDGKELRLYLDGQLQDTRKGVDYCSALSHAPLFVGADPANLSQGDVAEGFLNGRLRAARISRGVEYTDSFKSPERLDKTPDTVGLYDFTIDTGQYVYDRSGHGNHGIIIGAKYVTAAGD